MPSANTGATNRSNTWPSGPCTGSASTTATTDRIARIQSGIVITGDDSCACSAAWVRGFPTKVRKKSRDM